MGWPPGTQRNKTVHCEQNIVSLFTKGVSVMSLSSYAARANLSYLRQHHPDWSHAELAAALGYSVSWVEKWLKRIRCELADGSHLEHILQGHSRARNTLPHTTEPLVV